MPRTLSTATATAGSVGQAFSVIEKNWSCGECRADNYPRRTRCHKCKAARPAGSIDLVWAPPAASSASSASSSSSSSSSSVSSHTPWKEAFDAGTRQIYYYNQATMATSWARPAEMGPAPMSTGAFGRGAAGSTAQADLEAANARWLRRPARQQSTVDPKNLQAPEGANEFNIWYGKWGGDQFSKGGLGRDPAPSRCDPEVDAGFTRAGRSARHEKSYFCLHFARGACAKGAECTYLHHVPTAVDDGGHEVMRDVFGRERHQQHRDDMSGVGAFTSDCRTLYVGGLKKKEGRDLDALLRLHFGAWGELEHVNCVLRLSIAFVRYRCRINAEFALAAMANQSFGHGEVLMVRWAFDDPNPVALESRQRADADAVAAALVARGHRLDAAGAGPGEGAAEGAGAGAEGAADGEGEGDGGGEGEAPRLLLPPPPQQLPQQPQGQPQPQPQLQAYSAPGEAAAPFVSGGPPGDASASSSFSGSDAASFLLATAAGGGAALVQSDATQHARALAALAAAEAAAAAVRAPAPPPLDSNSPAYAAWYYAHYVPWATAQAALSAAHAAAAALAPAPASESTGLPASSSSTELAPAAGDEYAQREMERDAAAAGEPPIVGAAERARAQARAQLLQQAQQAKQARDQAPALPQSGGEGVDARPAAAAQPQPQSSETQDEDQGQEQGQAKRVCRPSER